MFQDRGGCSYFQVGLRLQLRIVDEQLEVTTLVPSAVAPPVVR